MEGRTFLARRSGGRWGIWPVLAEAGRVIFEGTPEFNATNPMGGLHGGWYGTHPGQLHGLCGDDQRYRAAAIYTTLEYKINITRAIPLGTKVWAIGSVSHAGRSTGVAAGEIRGIADNRLYATGSTTCLIMKAESPAR